MFNRISFCLTQGVVMVRASAKRPTEHRAKQLAGGLPKGGVGRTKVIQRDTKTGHVVSKARFEARLGNLKIGPNDHHKVDLYTAFRAPYVLGMRWCDCARWLTLRQAPKAARLRSLPMLEIVSEARISTIPKTAMRRPDATRPRRAYRPQAWPQAPPDLMPPSTASSELLSNGLPESEKSA